MVCKDRAVVAVNVVSKVFNGLNDSDRLHL